MIQSTDFKFPCHYHRFSGKVRDVYVIEEDITVIVATDRVSAFDVILGQLIPHKGQVLNQLAAFFLSETKDICPNHLLRLPDANVTIGLKCEPVPIEVVVRGYLCGHSWRQYKKGERTICGVQLPDGLRENDKLPHPILTPTTKAQTGHDLDITEAEIIKSKLLPAEDYGYIHHQAMKLFQFGQQHAEKHGLILADTKYEFGYREDDIMLIDEIHTPDSSRYFIADGFDQRQQKGLPQEQYSKEFLRQWLINQGFQGQEGTTPPTLTNDFINALSSRYTFIYEKLVNETFHPRSEINETNQIYESICQTLSNLGIKM